MKIQYTNVLVDNQEKALLFYTNVLGFQKKADVSAGDYRWLTVVSPENPDGVELLLEPNALPAAKTYQKELFDQGIPYTSFNVDDVQKEFERLRDLGVRFQMEPTDTGPAKIAMFDDTCGNLIQIQQIG